MHGRPRSKDSVAGAGTGSLLDEERRAVDAAVARALDWLAERQAELEDGSFPTTDAQDSAPLATCALAALAYMSAGHGTERGPHAGTVSRESPKLGAP